MKGRIAVLAAMVLCEPSARGFLTSTETSRELCEGPHEHGEGQHCGEPGHDECGHGPQPSQPGPFPTRRPISPLAQTEPRAACGHAEICGEECELGTRHRAPGCPECTQRRQREGPSPGLRIVASRGYYTIVDSYGSFGGQEARLLGRCLAAETQREPSVQVRRETESLERLRVEECVDGFDTVAAQFEHLECPRDVATVGVPAVLGERGAAVGVAAQKP